MLLHFEYMTYHYNSIQQHCIIISENFQKKKLKSNRQQQNYLINVTLLQY